MIETQSDKIQTIQNSLIKSATDFSSDISIGNILRNTGKRSGLDLLSQALSSDQETDELSRLHALVFYDLLQYITNNNTNHLVIYDGTKTELRYAGKILAAGMYFNFYSPMVKVEYSRRNYLGSKDINSIFSKLKLNTRVKQVSDNHKAALNTFSKPTQLQTNLAIFSAIDELQTSTILSVPEGWNIAVLVKEGSGIQEQLESFIDSNRFSQRTCLVLQDIDKIWKPEYIIYTLRKRK